MTAVRRPSLLLCVLCCAFVTASASGADAVIGWRTDGTGRYPAAKPLVEFSQEEGVLWRTPLPGKSHAAPVLVGDRLFVAADPAHLIAISTKDGSVEWERNLVAENLFDERQLGEIERSRAKLRELEDQSKALRRKRSDLKREKALTDERDEEIRDALDDLKDRIREVEAASPFPEPKKGGSGNTAGTPTSDGSRVYCVFATGIVTAHTLEGERLWVATVGPAVDGFGHSASPLLVDGKLVVHTKAMTALDPATGRILWQAEVPKRWGSPVATTIGSEAVVVSASGSVVRAADGVVLATKLFDVGHATPVIADGVIYAISKKSRAVRLPGRIEGDAVETETLWETAGPRTRTFSSALLHEGLLYNVDERAILEVYDAGDGSLVYRERLPFGGGRVYASVTLAGSRLFVGSDRGEMLVFEPGREFERVALNELAGFSGAPVFDARRMYLRGYDHLYAVGE